MRFCPPIYSRTGLILAALLFVGGAALAGPRRFRPRFPRPNVARPHTAPNYFQGGGPAPSNPNAEGLLRRMLVAENNLALEGTQVTVVPGSGQSVQHVLRNGARALRMDYLQPSKMAGEEILDNGRTYYHFLPGKNQMQTQASQVNTLRVRVPQVIQQVRRGELLVQWLGQDTVAGRACDVVGVTAQGASASARKFWIDPTNGAQLKIEQYGADGQLLSVSYYTSVTYNPPLNAHSFAPPQAPTAPGPQTSPQRGIPTPAQVGFTALQPDYLPPGFHYRSAAVTLFHGKKVAALRYTNGLDVLWLYETPGNGRGPADSFPHPNVLTARRRGLKIVLIGSLKHTALEAVVNSLR